jgi:hypothetical protein
MKLLADAEGSAHDIAIAALNAASEADAVEVGRTIARNNLFKAAIWMAKTRTGVACLPQWAQPKQSLTHMTWMSKSTESQYRAKVNLTKTVC